MKTLSLINPKIKEILGQAVFSGMEKGHSEVSANKIYDVGIGLDVKQRVVNAYVNYALNNAILAANEATLSAETVEHSSGHSLKITYCQFIIYPKQVDYQSSDWADEANYHKKLIANNPSKQYDLFDIRDPDNPVFVQLRFGKKKGRYFAVLRILDSSGGIYEEEELNLQAVTLAPKEEVNTQKKFSIRSEKVSGQ
jgi:hypothetical protein